MAGENQSGAIPRSSEFGADWCQPRSHREPRPQFSRQTHHEFVEDQTANRCSTLKMASAPKEIASQHFNPTQGTWLPILRTESNGQRYTALFSNTAHAHALGMTQDGVVILSRDATGRPLDGGDGSVRRPPRTVPGPRPRKSTRSIMAMIA